MNIFWIGLIFIIIFLMYQYRNLEIKYKGLLDKDYQNINKDKIINKINTIESDLNRIKKELNNGKNDA